MTTLATPQLEQYISQQIVSGQTVVFDEFIFANIPNLTADNLQNHLTIPSASHIVHRQAISQTGVVNQNSVVYSVTIGSDIGDFDFNFIGLINKAKGLLGIAIYTDTVKKLKNKNGIQGNSLTRSILLEFSNAPQHTNITVPAETWQIDFTLRLKGLDEKIRLTNRDLYGRAVFFDDGFLLKRKSGNNFTITAGTAYVEGVRTNITADENITLALPCSVYVDVVHHCTVTGAYQTEVKFLKAAKGDYLDAAGNQHYVQILADIDLNGNITDRRLLSPLLGINPKDLNDETESKADKTGHTHKLPLASLLRKGIVKLFSGLDSDSEDMAATPKAIKTLKGLIDAITRNLGNYIPNSKKSNAVNSNSADTVATSVAVKTAYDKGVEAKNIADGKVGIAGTETITGEKTFHYNIKIRSNHDASKLGRIGQNGQDLFIQNGYTGHYLTLKNDGELRYREWAIHHENRPYATVKATNAGYAGLNVSRTGTNGNWESRVEALPDRRWKFWTNSDTKGFEQYLPAKNGTILLDSDGSVSGNANTYVKRDGSGDVIARLLRTTYQDEGQLQGAIAFRVNNSNDNYTRYCNSPAAVRNWLGLNITYQKIGNFEIRKYPDGTMIQTYVIEQQDIDPGRQGNPSFNWAVAFTGRPLIMGSITTSVNHGHDAGINILSSSTNAKVFYYVYEHGNPNQGLCRLQFLAIGRWK